MKTELDSFLFDSGFLTFEFTKIEYSGSANNTTFIDFDFFNKRWGEWENSVNASVSWYFADCKGLGGDFTWAL